MAARVMSSDEVRRRATEPLIVGETVDLRDLIIETPLNLADIAIANVDFSGTHFRAAVSFEGAECRGLTWFRNCRFDSTVTFTRALFENDCRFDGAVVVGLLDFTACELRGAATFDRSRLQADACFDEAVVHGNLSFASATILGRLSLRHANCLGGLWLDGVELAAFDGEGLEIHGRFWLRDANSDALQNGVIAYGYVYR